MRTNWAYIALCLFAPLLWGIVSAYVFDFIQARRNKTNFVPPTPLEADTAFDGQEMYHI